MDSKISKNSTAGQPETMPPAEGAAGGSGRFGSEPAATSRAFVVQMASPSEDTFAGRVQHLATSDGGNFATLEDLVAIIRRVLRRAARRDESGDE